MEPLSGKIGIIGDVHQEDRLLERALQRLRLLGASNVLCTGDVVDGEGRADRCVDLLMAHGVHVVRGNHDRWLIQGTMRELPDALPSGRLSERQRSWLAAIPRTLSFHTGGGTLLLCHGLGDDDMAKLTPDDEGYALEVNDRLRGLITDPGIDIVVAGHSHRRMVRHFDTLTVINAGTLLHHHDPCFGLVDLQDQQVEFFGFTGTGVVRVERHELRSGRG